MWLHLFSVTLLPMTIRPTFLRAIALITLLLWVFLAFDFARAALNTTTTHHSAELQGPISATITLNPPAVQPGETVLLTLSVTNRVLGESQPAIAIPLPANIAADLNSLNGGMNYNAQENAIEWHPLLAENETQTLELPLRVTVATLEEPLHNLTIYISDRGQLYPLSAEFWVGLPPTISLSAPTTISVGQTSYLQATTSGSGPVLTDWDLGDGRIFQAHNPSVIYATAGYYTVRTTAYNAVGNASAESIIQVVPQPAAVFTLPDWTVAVDQPVTFINQSGGEQPLTMLWDFGDGAQSAEINPTHLFTQPGTYNVRLILQNQYGTSQTSLPVTVGTLPQATLDITTEAQSLQPIVAGITGDDSIETITWDMGDGTRHEGAVIQHSYRYGGRYTVIAQVANLYGELRLQQTVVVDGGFIYNYLPFIGHEAQQLSPTTTSSLFEPNAEGSGFGLLDLESLTPPDTQVIKRLIWYVNEARLAYGLKPLTTNDTMSLAAQRHTNDMASSRFRGHVGSDGSRPSQRLAALGYRGAYAGEATAWGFEGPRGAVEFWLASPAHRPIILNEAANEIGGALTIDFTAPSIYYWTIETGIGNPNYPIVIPTVGVPAWRPTATPNGYVAPTATPLPPRNPATPAPSLSTATPFVVVTATPTQEPTLALEPTPTQPAIATSTPPASLDVATATPIPTASAEPTLTLAVATATPTATPLPPTTEPTTESAPDPTSTPTLEPTADGLGLNPATATPMPLILATATPDAGQRAPR